MAAIKLEEPRANGWIKAIVDLEHDESTALAAIVAAIGAASVSLPPPANIIIPPVCASRAAEIIKVNGSRGVCLVIKYQLITQLVEVQSITGRE